jgi:hypothetical protein
MAKLVNIEWTVDENGGVSMDIQGMEGTACKPFHEDVSRAVAPFIGEIDVTDKPEMASGNRRAAAPIAASQRAVTS